MIIGQGRPQMIIGLVGFAQSGKSSVSDHLVKHRRYEQFAFADALKAVAYDCDPRLGVEPGELKSLGLTAATVTSLRFLVDHLGPDGAKQIKSVRKFYQDLGVAVREHVGQDACVDAVMRKAEFLPRAVISDVRRLNEADAITASGGYIVRVVRPGVTAINDHVSEHELSDYIEDARIWNDGTLEQLGSRVDGALEELKVA